MLLSSGLLFYQLAIKPDVEGRQGRVWERRGVQLNFDFKAKRGLEGREENVANWLGKLIFAKFRAICFHQF